jgi:sugar phosphate permease
MKWRVLALMWLLMFVNYIDRINLSVAGPTLMAQLHISPARFGDILAAFTLGYAVMQVPAGWLADRFGARAVLLGAPIAWSVFTALTGAVQSMTGLYAVRLLLGLGEGASVAASFKTVGDWFAPAERSRANGVFLTALALGPATVAPVAVWLLGAVGWRGLFIVFALPGIVVALLIWAFMPMAPPGLAPPVAAKAPTLWRPILAMPSSWLLFFGYFAFNIAFWGYLGWMPSYLVLARHIDLHRLGFDASIPYLAGFVGLLVIGWLGSGPLIRARAVLVALAYILSAVGFYLAYTAMDVTGSLLGLSIAAFFLFGGFGPLWAIIQTLTPAAARGSFAGFILLGGQIGGFLAPIIVGHLVGPSHSFRLGFLAMMAGLAVAAACMLALQPRLRAAGA